MSGARYLIRFDDICPTMNWPVWERIESILKQYDIKPILAVVPDNRDPKLDFGPKDDAFWQRIRDWQSAGWFIALHGYQHRYVTNNSGLLGINAYSEFAGLAYEVQRKKMTQAVTIFAQHGVRPHGWVAPAHSFDTTTVRILLELGVDVISDGFYARPVEYLGAKWLPQQMWQFRKMPFGLWTVCFHPSKLSNADIEKFRRNIGSYERAITSAGRVLMDTPIEKRSALDLGMSAAWLATLRWKKRLKRRPPV